MNWIPAPESCLHSFTGLPCFIWNDVLGADPKNIPPWLSAISLMTISAWTLIYTIRNIRATVAKNLNDMYISWHKLCIDEDKNAKSEKRDSLINRLRKPIIGVTEDSIVFTYLNMLHTEHFMRRKRLITKDQYVRALGNIMDRLSNLSFAELQQFLAAGFEKRFVKEAYDEYRRISQSKVTTNDGGSLKPPHDEVASVERVPLT